MNGLRKLPPFLLLILGLFTGRGHGSEIAPKFSIKEVEASTGSKFRRDVVSSGAVPLNLRYEQMSEAQQNSLKAVYEHMGPNDEPPFPAAGLSAIVTEMSEAQSMLQVQGRLRLHAHVNAEGRVTSIAFVESVDRQFDVYVAGILSRTVFKPARCAGLPCAQDYLFAWTLTLEPR